MVKEMEMEKLVSNKKHGIHITHNDGDAIGCALVLATAYKEFDFYK